jgi:hypothetical protein
MANSDVIARKTFAGSEVKPNTTLIFLSLQWIGSADLKSFFTSSSPWSSLRTLTHCFPD